MWDSWKKPETRKKRTSDVGSLKKSDPKYGARVKQNQSQFFVD